QPSDPEALPRVRPPAPAQAGRQTTYTSIRTLGSCSPNKIGGQSGPQRRRSLINSRPCGSRAQPGYALIETRLCGDAVIFVPGPPISECADTKAQGFAPDARVRVTAARAGRCAAASCPA